MVLQEVADQRKHLPIKRQVIHLNSNVLLQIISAHTCMTYMRNPTESGAQRFLMITSVSALSRGVNKL